MKATIKTVYEIMEEYAPKCLAYDGDNVGLLVGRMDDGLTGIVFAVDVNIDAIEMAKEMGANLIISHHPVIFDELKHITDEDATGRVLLAAIKNGIHIISAHTNLDAADEGVSQTLAEIAGLKNIQKTDLVNVMRVGEMEKETATEEFIKSLKNKLNIDTAFISKNYPEKIKTVTVVSGRGCSMLYEAKQTGSDIFLLGEIKHENAVYADIMDLCVLACGHHETEVIILERLKKHLQNRLNGLQLCLGIYDKSPMVEK
ncbi:MAG: Nif3-like dinuclear metal center hexameric protein [Eubacteriales bacterium]